MRIVVNEALAPCKFPCVMKSLATARIVLFSEPGVGTVVYDEDRPETVGEHSTGFIMSYFTPFYGAITLSNGDPDD